MQGDIDERKCALCRLLDHMDTDAGRGKSSKVPLGNWGRLTVALYTVLYLGSRGVTCKSTPLLVFEARSANATLVPRTAGAARWVCGVRSSRMRCGDRRNVALCRDDHPSLEHGKIRWGG